MEKQRCYHCGILVDETAIPYDSFLFCCQGCKSVYRILNSLDLEKYYALEDTPGNKPHYSSQQYHSWDDEKLKAPCVVFKNENVEIIQLQIPSMHCSSCIWVLEQFNRFLKGIQGVTVFFSKKTIQISYYPKITALSEIATQLSKIGYPPLLLPFKSTQKRNQKKLWYQIGISGFAFGNCMFLSFPSYFESHEFWLNQYQPFFDWIQLLFNIPVLLYAAKDYFISAWKGLIYKTLSLDIPLALGILTLFTTSTLGLFSEISSVYFDSHSGLVFFLLLGKYIQQNVYERFYFERGYQDFFPIGVSKMTEENTSQNVALESLKKGDVILLHQEEIIPADGKLIDQDIWVDYSFVTGESKPVRVQKNKPLLAGGKVHSSCRMQVEKTNKESFLMQLWQDEKRSKSFSSSLNPLTQKISRYFTPSILLLALLGGLYAYQKHPDQIFEVVTAILIVACPCALALSSPFVYGNLLHYFSREQFYVKNASVANRLTRINHIVFDKTGTLSFADIRKIRFIGKKLSEKTKGIITSLLQSSSHPLGQAVLAYLKTKSTPLLLNQKEVIGAGVEGTFDNQKYRLGSAKYVGHIPQEWNPTGSSIHFSIDGNYQGYFKIESQFRNGLKKLFQKLAPISISVLSGDSDHEKTILLSFGLTPDTLHFNKNPFEKIKFIEQLQDKGKFVAMLGDGLNDSGALKKSDMAIAVAPNRG
ncbi:MAG: heavy metal translocating P-type ATPase metal-binding domain-containing protein, partial [Flavobacteriaceae bacterium]